MPEESHLSTASPRRGSTSPTGSPSRRPWGVWLSLLCWLAVLPAAPGAADGLASPDSVAGLKVAASDAIGDVLPSDGLPQDITRMVAERRGDQLHLELHFVDAISPADSGLDNALFGFIDLDTDRLASTGALATVDYLTDRSSGLGSDLLVDLSTYSSADQRLDVVTAVGGEVLARASATFASRSVAVEVPLSVLGGHASLSTVAAVGNAKGVTDVVPDGGFLATLSGSEVLLANSRFAVDINWRDFDGATGTGTLVFQSDDSAVFWFFDAGNWELMVKVIDACAFNDRFWVFSAATTNVEFTVRITDTESGEVRSYQNALGVSAAAVTDTAAFATCNAGGA